MHILTRRSFLETASLAAALGLTTTRTAARQAPAQTAFTPIRRNVGYFTGRGGTIGWLVSSDALAVVDSQFPDTAQACLDGLTQKASRRIDLLANTHHHGDHTGGNAVFRPAVGFIVAHENVPMLMRRAAQGSDGAGPGVPDRTYEKVWTHDLGGERLRLRYYGPAHTSGDSVVTFEQANVVHMGDLMFNRRHPFIDRPAGASIANWITVLETTVKDHADDTIYIFGHAKDGAPVTGGRAELMQMRDYLTAVLDTVRKGIADGRSRDQITAIGPLKGFEDYQEAPPRLTLASVLGVAYDELQDNN